MKHSFQKIRRRFRFELYPAAFFGRELKRIRVKHEPWRRDRFVFFSIQRVAEDRMPDRRKMYADLMRASRARRNFKKRICLISFAKYSFHNIIRDRLPYHPPAVHRPLYRAVLEADRFLYNSLPLLYRAAHESKRGSGLPATSRRLSVGDVGLQRPRRF